MAKRKAPNASINTRPEKKVKAVAEAQHEAIEVEIQSAADLSALLTFHQDAPQRLSNGCRQVTNFVSSLEDKENPRSERRRLVFRQYIISASSKDGDNDNIIWPDIFKAWSFADHTSHAGLLAAIPALLTSIIHATSQWEELNPFGVSLCKALLSKPHLPLIERRLSLPEQKPDQVGASFQLLTEITSYDLGSFARTIHHNGGLLFALVEKHLSPRLPSNAKSNGWHKVRSAALHFVLANFRYQSSSIKSEMIGQYRIIRSIFQAIDVDPPPMIIRIIEYSQRYILQDTKLSTSIKGKYLAESTLVPLAKLWRTCRHTDRHGYADAESLIRDFLRDVCTKSLEQHRIGTNQNGLVPVNYERLLDTSSVLETHPRLAIGRDREYVIRLPALVALLQVLRPENDLMERELAISIFKCHPKAQIEYFHHKSAHYFDPPKLTATWIGYATFLISLLRLSIEPVEPSGLNYSTDAQTPQLTIDMLLPRHLHRVVLERSLNQSSELVTYLTTQLVTASILRLQQWMKIHVEGLQMPQTESDTVVEAFSQRCPRSRCIMAAYKKCSPLQLSLKMALAKLLGLYYSLLPQLAIEDKSNVPTLIAESLLALRDNTKPAYKTEAIRQQLGVFMGIASQLPDMRWWNKPGMPSIPLARHHKLIHDSETTKFSPFMAVLRMACSGTADRQANKLVGAILKQESILQIQEPSKALHALLSSLSIERDSSLDIVLLFLDSCIMHLVKQDIKYTSSLYALIDMMDLRRDKEARAISPLILAIADQWGFFAKSNAHWEVVLVANWIARFMDGLDSIGENRTVLRSIRDDMAILTEDLEAKQSLKSILSKSKLLMQPKKDAAIADTHFNASTSKHEDNDVLEDLARLMQLVDEQLHPSPEPEDHPELTRWRAKDLEDAIDDGHVKDLLLCLCSTQSPIRRQALSNMIAVKSRLAAYKGSQDERGLALSYWVVGELCESYERSDTTKPLPSFVACFAARALAIERDPRHILFAKINDFVDKHPAWDVAKMPGQWARRIIFQAPDKPDQHFREVLWLLDLLKDGLSTPSDVELYFAANVFEPVLAGCVPGAAPDAVWIKTLHLLYRCALIGGSRTLLTRFGLLAWLEACVDDPLVEADIKMLIRCLAIKLGQTVDKGGVIVWSGGSFARRIEALKEGARCA